MIVRKGVEVGEVITFKLSSGEELMARLEDVNETQYVLAKPRVVGMSAQGPALMPFLFTADPDRTISINKATVLVAVPSDKEFATQYLTSTTGIKLV